MGRKCSVEGCQSDSNRPQDVGVTFHKVPPHSDIRPKWLSLCKIPEDKKNVKVIYVCSRHFLRADFCNFKGKKYMLKQGVLPSVFPWDKSKLEAIKAEAKKDKPVDIKEEPVSLQNDRESDNIDIKEETLEDNIKKEVSETEFQQSEDNIKDTNEGSEEKPTTEEKPCLGEPVPSTLSFTIDARLEALDFNNEWYPARIVEIDYEENEVFIHFENFSSKYDEWISMNSSRLRSPQISTITKPPIVIKKIEVYTIGERCLAAWSDARKFPATITKVLENDTYEVLFDDGFVKVVKAHRLSKAVGKHLQSSPLFDPIKSSKQDRRDKKRKLNVASLFRKRPKLEQSEDKPRRSVPNTPVTPIDQGLLQSDVESPGLTPTIVDIENWKPSWYKGKPCGTESTLQTQDGVKVTYIVPDPRLPPGWNKHLLRRTKGNDAGKWDTVIVSPDPENKRFRSKTDVLKYIEDHPDAGIEEKMFDFSLVSKRKRKNPMPGSAAKSPQKEQLPPPLIFPEEPLELEQPIQVKEEDNSNSLKILFEDDAYKCPIEGCGKTFRRENLAQMHVKHYHPEYTKFLDSTPNVADLAYARTVGENLDRSPGPQKPPPLKPAVKTTPKTPKHVSGIDELPDLKPVTKPKAKDAEIIKLLNTKPFNKLESDGGQSPSSSGTPTSPYADIKLKDLLNRNNDDTFPKSVYKTKSPGIKTLLPGHRPPFEDFSGDQDFEDYPKPPKRRRGHTEHMETIIKGGEVIKIVRMKQEEIINCTCGFMEEDGLMIQCELCLCWQHGYCNNIERESQVPDKYVCYICQNPLRERPSRKYYHDQDWLTKGVLPVGSYHTKDEEALQRRFEKLKSCHDLSGGLIELDQYHHSLKMKVKIAEAKNHPKLYLWSKPWPKSPLPEKMKLETGDTKPKIENDSPDYLKNDFDVEKETQNENSMLMMILKAGKNEMNEKMDLNTLMDNNSPIIPQPEAAIESADCRLNLLEHLVHQHSLVEERLDEFEKQIDLLEAGVNHIDKEYEYPRTRNTMQMLMRDLDTLKEFSQCSGI